MAKSVRGYGKIKLGLVDAGIADLSETVSWFEKSRLRYTHGRFSLFLAEGFLRRGDRIAARPLIDALLRQVAGDLATARELLVQAGAIFHELGTLDEPARVEAARAALDRGAAIPLLGSSLR